MRVDYDKEREFSIDNIKKIVATYNLKQNNGIGFVSIMESFNKQKKSVICYQTFFDFETRELLYVNRMRAKLGSKYGYTKYWEVGALKTFSYFPERYYKNISITTIRFKEWITERKFSFQSIGLLVFFLLEPSIAIISVVITNVKA